MTGPATAVLSHQTQFGDNNSDYGSEFSPEEEEIVARLLSAGTDCTEEVDDNPIITGVEEHEPAQAVRLPRALTHETRFQTLGGTKTSVNDIASTIKVVNNGSQYGRLALSIKYRQH